MNPTSLFFGLGAAGIFSCRVFLPALITSLLLRFGAQIPWLGHFGLLLQTHAHQPVWFTSNWCIATLAVLSALELLAQKDANARRVLQEIDVYGKALLALLTTVGVIDATDANFVRSATINAGYAAAFVPFLAAIATWRVATLRQTLARAVYDHVEGTPLAHLLNWLEELWTVFGTLLLVLFPVLMLIAAAAATAGLALARRRLHQAEEATRLPCISCGQLIYRCAVACPHCKTPLAAPTDIGFLGQTLIDTVANRETHSLRLLEKRRCRFCAAPQRPGQPTNPCRVCQTIPIPNQSAAEAYNQFIAARLPTVLVVSLLLSLIPVLGLIAGLIYMRMQLVLPYSQYLPMGRRFWLGWGMRLLFIVLVFVQIVPIAGGLVVPILAVISFAAYRNQWTKLTLPPPAEIIPPVSPELFATRTQS